ncbi:MAG: rhomboid family intramembrane serine protease [Bacillaceae bacterium]|nr:rhomboid family intramembrane serine protease [Bacillaceae bacterium]
MEWENALLYLWKTAYNLVKEEDYQFLHAEGDQELILVKNRGRQFKYIRLMLVDYMWPAQIDRDLQASLHRLKTFQKQVNARRVEGLNLYLFRDATLPALTSRIHQHKSFSISKGNLSVAAYDLDNHEWIGDPSLLKTFDISAELFSPYHQDFYSPEMLMDTMRKMEVIQQEREQREKAVFFYGRTRLTYWLVGIHVLLFVLMELSGGSQNPYVLIHYGAKYNPLILEGEWWRFITPMFLHIGLIHLLFNNVALYFIGNIAEKIYGSIRFFWIYMIAGVAGVVASFYFSPHLSAGASGAIFGLFGALLHFGLRYRDLFFRTIGNDVIFIVILNLGIGFLFPGVDNYAHLGGLIGGFLAATAVALPHKKTGYLMQRLAAFVILVVLMAIGIMLGFRV